MSFNVAIAMLVGCVLGVFSTIILVGLAFSVKNRRNNEYEQEETDKDE